MPPEGASPAAQSSTRPPKDRLVSCLAPLRRTNDLSDRPLAFRLGLIVVVLIQAFSALGFLQRDQVNFSSDQAVPALMALEIRDHGAHPLFYWGVPYAGSLEPHLLALVFRVLPDTVASYRIVMFAFLALATLFTALAAARAFGPRSGLLAGAYLAAGPSFLFYKILASDGAYASFFMLAAASVYLATRLGQETGEARSRVVLLALGICLGVAWWVIPLSIVLGGVVAAGVVLRPGSWLKPIRISLLCAGFLLGASPWLAENVRTGFVSLRSAEMSRSGSEQLLSQGRLLLARGVPVLLGGRSPGGRDATFPGSEAISVVLLGGLVVSGTFLVRREKVPAARFLALSSTILLVAPVLMALSRARTDFREDPRYLLSCYVGIAVLSGVLLARLIEREASAWALVFAGTFFLLGPLSQLRSQRYGDDPRHGRIPETIALAEKLGTSGIREVYTEYWIAYRLTFLSRGQVVASPFGDGAMGPVRDVRALERVDGVEHPAFILEPGQARQLLAFLDARSAPYSHEQLPDLGRELIWGIPPGELAIVRACRCFPAPESPSPGAGPESPR
ncbi:MAG: hypothetical protein HY900_37955 [Deltaproteobacteria bacterium]|nr:hypothetical protein [Deltaproteobacteria bacterium]